MNIHNKGSLTAFSKDHADCAKSLEKWHHDVKTLIWKKPSDVVSDFNTARIIKNDRAVFEINRNDYRLIVSINYQKGWVFIKFIGTHAQYDRIEPETVEQFKPKRKG